MLDKLTLVIATKNRHQYLERIIDYYSGSGITIIVADATKEKYTKQLPSNFSYAHYPEIHYCIKLDDVFKKINTPYTLLCADDDFIIPGAIEKCISFLDANADYASAQGYYMMFTHSKNKLFYSLGYRSSIGCDFNEDSASERIKKFNKVDIQFFYCVHRTETLREIFSFASKKIYSLNLLELLIGNTVLIKGKHKALPVFYSVREVIAGSTGRSDGLAVISVSPKHKEQYAIFFAEIVRQISVQDHISNEEASAFFRQSIQNHIGQHSKTGSSFKNSIVALLNNKIIPLFIRKQLQHLLLLWQQKKQGQRIEALKNVIGFSFNDSENRKELKEIEKYIFKYNIRS